MAEETKAAEVANTYERHFQTLIVGLTLVVLSWVGVTITNNSKTIARMDERSIAMEKTIEELGKQVNVATQDRYTWQDAKSDQRAFEARLSALEKRIEALEGR